MVEFGKATGPEVRTVNIRIAQIACVNGLDKQLEKLAEECAEVVQASLKFKRDRNATTMVHLAEEICDAQILMDQIAVLCPEIPEYSQMFRELKLKREMDRIEEKGEASE